MKKFKKCFSVLFLSCFLAFGNLSGCYLEVQAFEWVIPSIGIEEALKALLMLLGVTIGGKAASEVDWSELKQNCISFQEEQGNSSVAVSEWWNDVINGKLNQASECWQSFKEWVKSSFAETSVTDNNTYVGKTIFECVSLFNSTYNVSYSLQSSADANRIVSGVVIRYQDNYPNLCIFLSRDDNPTYTISLEHPSSYPNGAFTLRSSANLYGFYSGAISKDSPRGIFSVESHSQYVLENFPINSNISFFLENVSDLSGVLGSSDSENYIYNPALIPYLDLAPSDSLDTAIPDVVPLPWQNLGDDVSAINDELDAIIDAVNSGVLDIADAMERILDKLNVMAVDTTTDIIYPSNPDKPDGQPDETLQDKVNENKDNMGFSLAGLEKVFPFCIPFDIYAFMTLLVADPVAPVINWPFYNPISKENLYITVDFSEWESVVILIRYIFDFLFIIGLLLMARALIGGGDSA